MGPRSPNKALSSLRKTGVNVSLLFPMRWRRMALLAAMCSTISASALPQTFDISSDALQRMLQSRPELQQFQQLQQLQQQPGLEIRPSLQTYQPVDPQLVPLPPPSRLEGLYSSRAGRPL